MQRLYHDFVANARWKVCFFEYFGILDGGRVQFQVQSALPRKVPQQVPLGQTKFPVLTAPSLTWNQSKLKQDGKDWVVRHDPETHVITLEYCASTVIILR